VIDSFRSFALDGLFLPAFLVAFGSAVVLMAGHRWRPTLDDLARAQPFIRYLATRNWDRPGGFFMIGCGVLLALLRMMR
jgi:hypothetical protein